MRLEDIKKLMTELEFQEWGKWMRGQTCGIYPDGETDFYEHDVNRFLAMKRKGIPTYWD